MTLSLRAENLYVSLGAHCEVANFIGYNGLRTAAYPFDWMLTTRHSVISILEQDFAHYLDISYLQLHQFGVANLYYHIEFRHDWPYFGKDWFKMDIKRTLPEIIEKYQRRIERFYQLADYQGKVYFIRAPIDIDYALDYYPTFTNEAKTITIDEALGLKKALLNKFPNLDFELIIINYLDENEEPFCFPPLEKIQEFRVRLSHKFEDWESLLQQLNNDTNDND